jgi:hypothetical protein
MIEKPHFSKQDAWLKASPCLIFVFCVLYGIVSEKIPDDGHRGFFFSQLGRWVRDLDLLWQFQIDSYALKHIAPAAILYLALKVLAVNPTDSNIILGFIIEQSVCYAAISYLWLEISKHLHLSIQAQFLGMVTLIFNVILKVTMFMPISREVFPQVLSLLMFYAWITHNIRTQLISLALLIFTSPQGLITGLILFVFQHKPLNKNNTKLLTLWRSPPPYAWMLLLIPVSWLMYRYDPVFLEKFLLTVKPNTALLAQFLAFSFITILSYYTIRTYPLTKLFLELNIATLFRLAVAICIVIVGNKLQLFFASHEEMAAFTSPLNLLKIYFWINASYYPGLFFVLLVINFGPMILLAVHYLKNFLDILSQYGFALIFIFVWTFFRVIEGEPRHLVDVMPILWPFLIKSIDTHLNKRNVLFLVFASLFFSRIWLNLTYNYPELFFWYNYTCSLTGFIVQSLLVILTFFIIFITFPRTSAHQLSKE